VSAERGSKPQPAPEVRTFRRLLGAAVLLVLGWLWLLQLLGPSSPGRSVPLDTVEKAAATPRGVVSATFYDEDSRVAIKTTKGDLLSSAYQGSGEAAALTATLVNNGATVTIDQQWGKHTLSLFAEYILPLVILALAFGAIIVRFRGGSSQVRDLFAFSQSGAAAADGSNNPVRFGDVGAAAEAVEELAEVRDYLRNPRRFEAMGANPPKGVLLAGPPGCGKTLIARALAGEAGVPFFALSGSQFVESLVGVGAARVRDLFKAVKASAPAIVFIDELDAAGRKRGAGIGGGNDEREQTLNQLLVEMDGFERAQGIVVIGATNRPDILDPALLRPGRFDRHVIIDVPDVRGRLDILQKHAGGRPLANISDLEYVAKITPGFTGADLASVLNEGALLAIRRTARQISRVDLDEAVQRVMAGPRRRGRVMAPEELFVLAHHEAGHALVSAALGLAADVQRVSIVARGQHVGHTALTARSDRKVLRQSELLNELVMLMAGVAAEEIAVGERSTAGADDIAQATDRARQIAGRFGMTEHVGSIHVVQQEGEVFLGRDYTKLQNLGSRTLEAVDEAVRELVDNAEEQARALLTARRELLTELAELLLGKETVEGEMLVRVLAAAAPPNAAGGVGLA